MREEAATAYLAIAFVSRGRHNYVEADQHFTAALAFLDQTDRRRRAIALAGRGKTRYLVHRIRDALDDLRAARELAEALGDAAALADLLLEEATALDWAHSFAESAERVEEARPLVERTGDPRMLARYLVTLGRSLFRQQRVAEAIDPLLRGASGASQSGDYEARVVALLMLSSALVLAGRLDEAETAFCDVIALCGSAADRLHLGSAHANRSLLWTSRGSPERAMDDLYRAIQLAREVGNPWLERNATHTVAELLYWNGRYDEALSLARRSRVLEERFVEHVVPDDSLLLARIHAARGELDEAAAYVAWVTERCAAGSLAPTERAFLTMISLVIEAAASRESATSRESTAPRESTAAIEDPPAPLTPLSPSPTPFLAWDSLVDEATGDFPSEELLEVLYFRALVSLWNGRYADTVHCLQQSRSRLEGCPIWKPRFAELSARVQEMTPPACSRWLLDQAILS
jgi:tetratricopeptide (TPR) repeat protein